jgi:hypothetical protein
LVAVLATAQDSTLSKILPSAARPQKMCSIIFFSDEVFSLGDDFLSSSVWAMSAKLGRGGNNTLQIALGHSLSRLFTLCPTALGRGQWSNERIHAMLEQRFSSLASLS